MTGRPLNSVRAVPPALLRHLGSELDIATSDLASLRALYARGRTLFDHQHQACECLGFKWMTEHQRRALERECRRNLELMWRTGRLAPDFKTIADFRRDSGKGIRNVCRRFVLLCRELKLFSQAVVAIEGSKFKAVNGRERNYTEGKIARREREIETNIQRYLGSI
jgi:hypothetical protein